MHESKTYINWQKYEEILASTLFDEIENGNEAVDLAMLLKVA